MIRDPIGREQQPTVIDGEPWFVAKDVCDVLGDANARKALADHLDDDEKSTVTISYGTSPKGGNPNMNVISESGLYALIFRSNKPEAKQFSRWVRRDVLPSIRKSGMYLTDQAADALQHNPEEFAKMAARCSALELVSYTKAHSLDFLNVVGHSAVRWYQLHISTAINGNQSVLCPCLRNQPVCRSVISSG